MQAVEVARKAVGVASDKQAADILLLDLRGLCSFADYFVICHGESQRQLEAISEGIGEALAREGTRVRHREGKGESGWVLLDFGDVIVHIFDSETRRYYQLDRLWGQAVPVLRIQ